MWQEIFYLMTHLTHFLLIGISEHEIFMWQEMFYLMTHSTHFN